MGRSRYARVASLADEDRWDNLLLIGCNYCRTKRNYRPADLRTIFGDLPMDDLERRLRCEQCNRPDYMTVNSWKPLGAEWKGLVVRRLVRIETVRRPIWRDERTE